MSIVGCVIGCQAQDHERLGHEHFWRATYSLDLTRSEREMMLNGWERAWVDRVAALNTLLAAIQEAVDSLDATTNYEGEVGWKERFLGRHDLRLEGRRVVWGKEE